MARVHNPAIDWILSSICLIFAHTTTVLPISMARFLGKTAANIAFYAVPRIQKVGYANLDLAYGDSISQAEKKHILKKCVENAGIVAAEFTRTSKLAEDKFFSKWMRVEGIENVDRDKAAIILCAHMGNWEWIAGSCKRPDAKSRELCGLCAKNG